MYQHGWHQSAGSPGFHVSDHSQIVLVPADATLYFMKQVTQLHEDDQAGHGQPDVAK